MFTHSLLFIDFDFHNFKQDRCDIKFGFGWSLLTKTYIHKGTSADIKSSKLWCYYLLLLIYNSFLLSFVLAIVLFLIYRVLYTRAFLMQFKHPILVFFFRIFMLLSFLIIMLTKPSVLVGKRQRGQVFEELTLVLIKYEKLIFTPEDRNIFRNGAELTWKTSFYWSPDFASSSLDWH